MNLSKIQSFRAIAVLRAAGVIILSIFLLLTLQVQASLGQIPAGKSVAGLSLQVYPAGLIGNIQYAYQLAPKQTVTIYGGLNITNRRDWGEQDDETGVGVGPGIAWRYYLHQAPKGLYGGIRTDLWFLNIDWKQDTGETGSSDITVLQPTAVLGYTHLAAGPWIIDMYVSLGAEINVRTRGEPVGEGAILLAGLSVGYRL